MKEVVIHQLDLMIIVGPFQLNYSTPLGSRARDTTITLGKTALFVATALDPKQSNSGAADLRTMTVGRELGPSFGRKEKMREGRAEPMPELGSLQWLPLL